VRAWAPALALVLALVAAPAAAHDFRPGVLSLVEEADGGWTLAFAPPIESTGDPAAVTVQLPPQCARRGDRVFCDAPGLAGELAVAGMHGRSMKTLVTVRHRDGRSDTWLLTAAAPRVTLRATPARAALPWLELGVEHILGGLDHLAFVLGLLLVLELRADRRLLATITAFTVAHSLSLALTALDVVRVPQAPVEACIALSVLLVAREATHREPTALRRWPWLAASGFGLVHGLGFAGALAAIGLPQSGAAWSLAWFNLGVELGQLAVVALVVGLAALARRSGLVLERGVVGARVHRAASYALGSVAAWWLVARVVDLAH
jgi:hydrogenase/urease accessory protein HupE